MTGRGREQLKLDGKFQRAVARSLSLSLPHALTDTHQRQKETERDRERQRETERDRERWTDADRQSHSHKDSHKHTQTNILFIPRPFHASASHGHTDSCLPGRAADPGARGGWQPSSALRGGGFSFFFLFCCRHCMQRGRMAKGSLDF